MARRMTIATAVVTGASVLAFWGGALAQTMGKTATQADVDQCNHEAQLLRGGSASPGSTGAGASTGATSGGALGSSTSPGGTGGAIGSVGAGSSVSGSTAAPSTGAGMSAAGATGGTGSLSGGSTLGGSGSSVIGDAQLRGMAGAGQSDAAYQQAYRDCMTRKGF
jgi:hypothetical protein